MKSIIKDLQKENKLCWKVKKLFGTTFLIKWSACLSGLQLKLLEIKRLASTLEIDTSLLESLFLSID